MTNEKILEELKKLKMHTDSGKGEHELDVSEEVAEIDSAIEEYNEKIAVLEAKIADESNYQYNNENEERDLTIEILEESFENQLEVMAREDEEYKTLQDLATSIFTDYNLEIATLNNDIEVIERRLRKNDIAVRKNIGIKLTDEELFALNSDLEQKRARIQECEEMKAKYVEDLSNYGELITANNRKREIVLAKQESLGKLKEHRDSKVGSIDNAKLRIDKDELANLKAGLAALESRKEYITYNPNAEIDKLIQALEQNKVQTDEVEEELNVGIAIPTTEELQTEEKLENKFDKPSEDKAQSLINAYLNGTNDLVEENKIDDTVIPTPLGIPEKTSAEVGLLTNPDLVPLGNPELDVEREAEIEEADKILKEKKKEGWFKKNWKKWVAAGLATIALIAALKGCNPETKAPAPEDINDNTSQSQTDEDITEEKENEFNDKYEIPGDNDLEVEREDNKTNITPEPESELTTDSITDQVLTPEPEVEPTPDPVPEPIPEPTVETGEAQLEANESIISAEDLLKGNINEDTVIEHGDEVGKTTDNAELKDYTEDGKAIVEFEKTEEKPIVDEDQFIKNLEEFMGGDIAQYEPQWVDEISSGKTR